MIDLTDGNAEGHESIVVRSTVKDGWMCARCGAVVWTDQHINELPAMKRMITWRRLQDAQIVDGMEIDIRCDGQGLTPAGMVMHTVPVQRPGGSSVGRS